MRTKRGIVPVGTVIFVLLFIGILSSPMGLDPVQLGPLDGAFDNHTLAAGEGWLEGFRYREKFAFSEATGAGTDYQIRMIVYHDTDDGSDGSGNICTEGNAQADFDDIRFTDDDGSTELDYWLEEYTASTSATFWFEVRDSLESGQNAFAYIYYGNAGVSTTSNGTNTFIWFDDFSSDVGWSKTGSTFTISGGYLHWDATASYGDCEMSIDALGTNWAMGGHVNQDTNANVGAMFLGVRNTFGTIYGDWDHMIAFRIYDDLMLEAFMAYDGASTNYTAFDETPTTDTDYWWNIQYDDGTMYAEMWTDHYETSWGTGDAPVTVTPPDDDMDVVSFCTRDRDGWDGESDYMYIRKWVTPEPYVVLIYSEEQAKVDTVSAQVNNPDDTNRIYAEYREYYFGTIVSMESGYVDITYLVMHLKQGVSTLASLKYDQDTDTFSKLSGAVTLDTENSEAIGSGPDLNCTFYVTVGFGTPHLTDYFFDIDVYDVFSGSDTDDYGDYDVYSDLDFSSFSLNDGSGTADRGDYNSIDSITSSGVVIYEGSARYPPSDKVDVFTYQQNIAGSPWTDTTLVDGAFSMTADSDDIVASWDYTFVVVAEGNAWNDPDLCHDTHTANYIADRVQVQGYEMAPDGRVNIGANIIFKVELHYDYDNSDVTDGTITVNGRSTVYYASGKWQWTDNEATVTSITYDTVVISGDTHGMTSVDQNSQEATGIWDRVQISTTTVADNRVNINDNVNIDFTLIYDYDNTAVTDGTVTIEGFAAAHQGSGVWRITRTSASVISVTYDEVTATGNTHGITVVDMNGQSEIVIWDRVQVQSYTVVDTRVNTDDNVNIDVLLWYDFDDTQVTDGTVTINGFAASHQGSGVWRITRTSASVTSVTYDTVAVTGNTHGITVEDQNGQDQQVIWDRVKVLLIVSNSTYNDLNDVVLLTVSLEYEFDSDAITAGTFSLRYGSTYLTLTHEASGDWIVTDTSSSSLSRTYNYVNGTATLYGITVVNMNSKSVIVHWDRILITLNPSIQWTVVGYNTTMRATGVFEGNSSAWSGTITFNSTWDASFYPTQTTAGNYTFTVTSISGVLQGFLVTNPEEGWCIWDDIAFSSPTYFWVQYSVDQVWLIWYAGATTYWEINGTCDGVKIQSHMNGTDDDWTYVLDNATGVMSIGPFNTAWHYVNITINAEVAGYDWLLWTRMLTVDILHSILIEDSGMDVQDDWITFWIHSNWGNSTFTIADNMTGSFVEVGYSSSEGWYQIAKPTVVGTHWYWILVNGSHSGSSSSGQTLDPSLTNDSWVWLDFKFVVNPVTFSITSLIMLQNNESIIVQGFWHTPNTTLTWIAYEAGVMIDSGVLTLAASGEYNAIYWLKNEPTTFNNLTLSITADGSTINLHSYSYVLDSATYINNISGGGLVVFEGDNFFDESTTHEGISAKDMATVVLELAVLVFLTVILTAIITWRDGRNKRREDYLANIASGGYH